MDKKKLKNVEWFYIYKEFFSQRDIYIPSREGMISYLEDNHGLSFKKAKKIVDDPEVTELVDARTIASVYHLISKQKGRHSRELMNIVEGIKERKRQDGSSEEYKIVIEKSDKEV